MRFLTAGESHGPGLVAIIEGFPRGLRVTPASLARDLERRRGGYGRGARARGEPEEIEFLSGIRGGSTTGSPIAILLRHRHWETWRPILDPLPPEESSAGAFVPDDPGLLRVKAFPTVPRPGHADLAGAQKYSLADFRDVIERASARETAARTVAGSLARSLLERLGIRVGSYVSSIGPVAAGEAPDLEEAWRRAEDSCLRTIDPAAERMMIAAIDRAREEGDTLGGTFEVAATGVPAGLGGYTQWDRRLDARIAAAVMSIPSVKGVEIGAGFGLARMPGSTAHDAIYPDPAGGIRRKTNNAGGIEGGLSNGEAITIRAAVKPVPTLYQPLPSVDLRTGAPSPAVVERSDTCVVPAAAVVAEAMVAWTLADALQEKFGGDTVAELESALQNYGRSWPPWRRAET